LGNNRIKAERLREDLRMKNMDCEGLGKVLRIRNIRGLRHLDKNLEMRNVASGPYRNYLKLPINIVAECWAWKKFQSIKHGWKEKNLKAAGCDLMIDLRKI
jgi:hypothetical protein